MKKAIMYGGGNIGRGFIGKVFADSGYEVCFLDVVKEMIDEFNNRGQYTVRIVSNAGEQDTIVKPVRAVNSLTPEAIDEIVTCDIMATAVGVNILPRIAPTIAKAVVARMEKTGKPLDIILCENQLEADVLMRGWIYECLTDEQKAWADKNLGLIEASIGRMVPPLTPEMREKDRLLICVEPYCDLPVDKDAFKGEIPDLVGLVPYSPFEFYIKRKLFLHNGGHALCAYLGYTKGYEYIWQAIQDPEIYEAAKASMTAAANALIAKFGEGIRANVEENVVDLLERFQNLALKDTIARVGADPVRKLRSNDRIVGAALFCIEQGVDPMPIVKGIIAALKFDRAEDATAPEIQKVLKEEGVEAVMTKYMGLTAEQPLYKMILDAYKA
ncbi:MAG: mannitol-1-phosphate 5-dehydrogenase [Clostridia bacterium]|nr:mannitol-1-phosphate 5-dehydrogenase [Clostridia bacterium]